MFSEANLFLVLAEPTDDVDDEVDTAEGEAEAAGWIELFCCGAGCLLFDEDGVEEETKFEEPDLAADEVEDEAVDDGPPSLMFTAVVVVVLDGVVRDVSTVGMGTFKIEFCKEFSWLF